MFTAALCTTARKWKQPRCPLIDKRTKKLWYVYIMEYYSAIKRNASESVLMDREGWCATVHGVTKSQTWLSNWTELNWLGVDEPTAYYTQWSKSERERQISYINLYVNYWWSHLQGSRHNRLLDTKEGVGWFERAALKHIITICKRDSQWEFAVWCREPKSGAVTT